MSCRYEQEPIRDIMGTLASSACFRTWVTILVGTQLVDDLRDPGPWLVIAPTDAAFARIAGRDVGRLFATSAIESLIDFAERRVARSASGQPGGSYTSLLGDRFSIGADDRIDDGTRIVARRKCSNGVVAVVDRIVLPPSRVAHGRVARPTIRAA